MYAQFFAYMRKMSPMYQKSDFRAFSEDSQRITANLEQAYDAWLDAKRELESMPVGMRWSARENKDYLLKKDTSDSSEESLGPRSESTEKAFNEHHEKKVRVKERIQSFDKTVSERASLYRRLRLPSIPDRQAEILRRLDIDGLLGKDLMVVGTNAFHAYELFCGAKFPTGNEETEDFDLAWCRHTRASLMSMENTAGKSLISVLRRLDSTYAINPKKPYQAINQDLYEVELLAAPSTHPLPADQEFEPMATLVEQEWLLEGTPIQCAVATIRGRACPMFVPDPRWMAMHKLWLSEKPERKAAKKPKDRRQGEVLMDATMHFLKNSHPLDLDFVMDLPEELRPYFNAWASSRNFIPSAPTDFDRE